MNEQAQLGTCVEHAPAGHGSTRRRQTEQLHSGARSRLARLRERAVHIEQAQHPLGHPACCLQNPARDRRGLLQEGEAAAAAGASMSGSGNERQRRPGAAATGERA